MEELNGFTKLINGRRGWKYEQSGKKKNSDIPNAMVITPSVRKSLIKLAQNIVKGSKEYHCQPDRPCEPDTVSKANARTPLMIPEKLPRMSVLC